MKIHKHVLRASGDVGGGLLDVSNSLGLLGTRGGQLRLAGGDLCACEVHLVTKHHLIQQHSPSLDHFTP